MSLDQLEIQNLSAKYSLALDEGRYEDWLLTWSEDGIFESPAGQYQGIAGLKKLMPILTERAKGKRHLITNFVIDVKNNDATQTCYMTIVDVEKHPIALGTAVYRDKLRKTKAGEWKFLHRKIVFDTNYTLNRN